MTATVDVSASMIVDADIEPTVLLECSGSAEATASSIRALGPAGRAVLVGMGAHVLALPLGDVQDRELEIVGVFRYANTWPTAVELAASGRVVLDPLVTGHYPLTAVRDA